MTFRHKVFVTSDLHFGHKNILKFNPSTRPWAADSENPTREEADRMNEALIENWNSVVGPNDVVYNLGDVALCNKNRVIPILEQLNGRHILILGNHDQMFATYCYDGSLKINPIGEECLKNGYIRAIYPRTEIRFNNHVIALSHYAERCWNKSHHGTIMLYGHSHGSLPGLGRSMDVGIDACDMPSNGKPFLLDDVVEFLMAKEIHKVDHHGAE